MKYISKSAFKKLPKPLKNVFNKAKANFDLKKFTQGAIVFAVLLSSVSTYIYYTRVYLTPEQRFWNAISNSLSTSSIVRETQTGGTGNKNIEKTRFEFGSQATQNKISSVSLKSATTESNVTTESILTPNTQYVRYLNVFSSEKKADGSSYDFSNIKNVWAKQDAATEADAQERLRLGYIQPLISLAIFGNLSPNQRGTIMAKFKSSGAYQVDFKNVTYQDTNGRRYALYTVDVQTKKYVSILQDYLYDVGLGEFPPLDPTNYPDNAHVRAQFLLDVRSNTVSAIVFNGQNEHYQDYGVKNQVQQPSKTISLTELEDRLQAAQ